MEVIKVFSGRFRKIYLFGTTAFLYSTVFLVFYYWPQFLGKLLLPDLGEQLRVLSGVALTPLGFILCAFFIRKQLALWHSILLVLAIALTWLFWPESESFTPPNLYNVFFPVSAGMFCVGMFFGYRHNLIKNPPLTDDAQTTPSPESQ